MKESTVYELCCSSPECNWEPMAETYGTRSEAEEGLKSARLIEPSAFIVRTVRTRVEN